MVVSSLIYLSIIHKLIIANKFSPPIVTTIPEWSNNYEVVFVTVVFRHGDNIPQKLYPNDPLKRNSFYPTHLGKLTIAGASRAYDFGIKLRHRYKDLLGDTYEPHMVMARSTNITRTKDSLRLVLSALYPSVNQHVHNNSSKQDIIPIKYVDGKNDFLLAIVSCPLYVEELMRVENSSYIQTQITKLRPYMKMLSKWTGKEINSIKEMHLLHHTLMSEYSMKLPLPKWTHGIFPFGMLHNATVLRLRIISFNSKLRRLINGVLLKHIIDTMNGIVNNTISNKPKIHLFCAHDINIISLLSAFGIFEQHLPEYSSAVILELLRDRDNEYYVNIHHYLGIPPVMKTISIANCSMNPCPLNEFINLMADIMPIEEDMVCPNWETK